MADELLRSYQHVIESLCLIRGSQGIFDVHVDGDLIFSKKTIQKRHAEPGEVLGLFREKVGANVTPYPQND